MNKALKGLNKTDILEKKIKNIAAELYSLERYISSATIYRKRKKKIGEIIGMIIACSAIIQTIEINL